MLIKERPEFFSQGVLNTNGNRRIGTSKISQNGNKFFTLESHSPEEPDFTEIRQNYFHYRQTKPTCKRHAEKSAQTHFTHFHHKKEKNSFEFNSKINAHAQSKPLSSSPKQSMQTLIDNYRGASETRQRLQSQEDHFPSRRKRTKRRCLELPRKVHLDMRNLQ